MAAYPERLLRIEGAGLEALRVTEIAFFPRSRCIAKAGDCINGEPIDVHRRQFDRRDAPVVAGAKPPLGRMGGNMGASKQKINLSKGPDISQGRKR